MREVGDGINPNDIGGFDEEPDTGDHNDDITTDLTNGTEIGKHLPGPTQIEYFRMMRKLPEGDPYRHEVREKLIESNRKLVFYVVNKRFRNYQNKDELISYGNQGLTEAADKFDPERGVQFSTYAIREIYEYIRRFIYDLVVPEAVSHRSARDLAHYNSFEEDVTVFIQDRHRSPSYEELVSLAESNLKDLKDKKGRREKAEELAMRYLNGSHVYSIDISDDDGTSSRSVLVEPQSDDDTQEAALSPIGFEFIRDKIFSELSERERDILLMRFGLGEDKKEHTLDEIGKKHNLTRQRIKEILNELIPKCERIARRLRLSSN